MVVSTYGATVDRLIRHGGPIELFSSSQFSTTGITKAMVCTILWDGAYKMFLTVNHKE